MRKLIALALLLSVGGLVGCASETAGEKVERKVRNAADDIEDALD